MIFEGEPEVFTIEQLREKFYLWHCELIRGRRCACAPNALVLNPFYRNALDVNIYYAIYTTGFYITIEQNENGAKGPHAAKLNIQIKKPKPPERGINAWIGTTQLECHFFSETQIRKELHRALRKRTFFATNRHLNSRITLNSDLCLQF